MNNWGKVVMKAWLKRNDPTSSKWHPVKAARIYKRFASLIELAQAQLTAEYMVERYKNSPYTAYQRASDHATSYPSTSPQYRHWLDVCEMILQIRRRTRYER